MLKKDTRSCVTGTKTPGEPIKVQDLQLSYDEAEHGSGPDESAGLTHRQDAV